MKLKSAGNTVVELYINFKKTSRKVSPTATKVTKKKYSDKFSWDLDVLVHNRSFILARKPNYAQKIFMWFQ